MRYTKKVEFFVAGFF